MVGLFPYLWVTDVFAIFAPILFPPFIESLHVMAIPRSMGECKIHVRAPFGHSLLTRVSREIHF